MIPFNKENGAEFALPQEGIDGYPHADFLNVLVPDAKTDIRRCLDKGAHNVQMDFSGGFSPFVDDTSTAREITFEEIKARSSPPRHWVLRFECFLRLINIQYDGPTLD